MVSGVAVVLFSDTPNATESYASVIQAEEQAILKTCPWLGRNHYEGQRKRKEGVSTSGEILQADGPARSKSVFSGFQIVGT